jgi:hypothetical protein
VSQADPLNLNFGTGAKLPSYTINGTRRHHITPNMPQGMSICGQK